MTSPEIPPRLVPKRARFRDFMRGEMSGIAMERVIYQYNAKIPRFLGSRLNIVNYPIILPLRIPNSVGCTKLIIIAASLFLFN